jgi:hypothetical protein
MSVAPAASRRQLVNLARPAAIRPARRLRADLSCADHAKEHEIPSHRA